ncbi:hypothetical protein BU26DRAFT_569088 [Trematosphaeria pertusa]|uniref:Extracellular membrane protein CFEM domain-containing protein n=1 Tax=Trematosphaeria pertusa TaxID=390896 RepID=A0A6A6I182_9PLEO|nr:uncharacterized protein BU26DRAFT_569088 [Trematosphaeria pertusa]KAF2244081.1 hypothetical protein BU26DRAFT_569088 [Trematosphaeria pertusa]
MPSTITSAIVSTITIFVTLTSGIPQSPPDIPSAIEGLSECAQGVLFPLLADSQCNPGNFPCLCIELDRLGARGKIEEECSREEVAQYDDFQARTCPNPGRVVTPPNVTVTTSTIVIPISTGIVPTGTGSSNFSTTSGPFSNTTATGSPVQPTTPVQPTIPVEPSLTTSEVLIPTTGANGEPTTITSQVVSPVQPTSPSGPEFTGAAAAVEAPEFGTGRMGLIAGAIGLMGLVFAEL